LFFFFFFNDTATTEIYTLSLHDALPILVTLDGTAVTGWTLFGSGRAAATVPLTVGTHTVTCNAKCSVEVYGWSQAVSYLFAGGLDLKPIVIE